MEGNKSSNNEGKYPPSLLPAFQYQPPDTPINIIYADDDILLIDKPSGLLTVPGKHADHKDCLESRIQEPHLGFGLEARIVHRLDMDTSGLIILALNHAAHRHLGLQFERRHVAKTYTARIWGHPRENSGTIDLPLRCDWPNRPRQMVDHELGKNAETRWEIINQTEQTSDVLLYPKTGRSHQLRVHMLELGHPIIGDNIYAEGDALSASNRLCLHAKELEIYHPNGGERLKFSSPVPF